MKTKLITIDEFCNQPPGSFLKYVQSQEKEMIRKENERKERIRRSKSKT